ncbi:hypothetical protein V6N13_088786 [Hibiscus sabdariffa]
MLNCKSYLFGIIDGDWTDEYYHCWVVMNFDPGEAQLQSALRVKEVDVTRKMMSIENTNQHTYARRTVDNDADRSELVAPCKLKSQGLHVMVLEVKGRTEGKLKSVSRVDLI